MATLEKSVDFDGLTQYASIDPSGSRSVADFAIEAWLKVTAPTTSKRCLFWGEFGVGKWLQWQFSTGDPCNLNCQFDMGAGSDSVTASAALTIGAWHHCAFSVNTATGVATLYVDGVSAGTGGLSHTQTTASARKFEIGRAGSNYAPVRFAKIGWSLSHYDGAAFAASAADPQQDWAGHDQFFKCGDGDTLPTLTDSGSTGGWDLTAVNSPSIETDYPVAP